MPERPRRPAKMEDDMFKSIALMGAAIGLVVSVASAQAKLNPNGNQLNGINPNAVTINGLNNISLTNNGTSPNALAGFAVESVELPDGTVAAR